MASAENTTHQRTPEQQAGIRNTLIALCGVIALMLGLLVSNVLAPKGLSEDQLRTLGYYGFDHPRAITSFELTNHLGESVGVDEFKRGWTLVFFGFTFCPDVCPTTLSVLDRAVTDMKNRPQVVMVSVDPDRDSPQVLAQYIPGFNKDFIAYTGEFDQIVSLATQLNTAFGKVPGKEPGTYTVDHSASIVVINPNGEYHGFIKAPHQALKISQIMDSLML